MAIGQRKDSSMDYSLQLAGYRPGSTEPPKSFGKTFQVGNDSRKSQNRYQERLFSGPGSQDYSQSSNRSNFNKTYSRSEPHREPQSPGPRPSTPKRGPTPTKPSYVDETLFGERPIEPNFRAPWDDGKKPVFVMNATDYKMQNKLREQRQRSTKEQGSRNKSPMMASHTVTKSSGNPKKSKYPNKPKYRPTEVDELLFGNVNDTLKTDSVSWEARAPPSHDPLNTGRFSVAGSRPPSREGRPPSPGRPLSGRPSTPKRPESSLNKCHPSHERHRPSYVDESLFGPKPVEPDFPAPWEKKESKVRPLLFDSRDYKIVIDHRDTSDNHNTKPRSRPGSAKKNPDKPAPWR